MRRSSGQNWEVKNMWKVITLKSEFSNFDWTWCHHFIVVDWTRMQKILIVHRKL